MTDPERDPLDFRPTAEQMLSRIKSDAGGPGGRLRIYLGMAPGVGKTYRMLEEGHRRLARGTDVVVGFAEVHGRPHTAELLDGLEVVPRRRIEYRGVVVEEMDTDAIITRDPTVALIDELAHTNVPGSLHEKRWQDVEAIRGHGIHVVTTLNVQHLDSVADAVATITGAPVNERLPDEVLAGADEIELIDMSPHALRQRMKHGNVYPPERSAVALAKFFTEANLTALRELALRLVARRVEGQLEDSDTGQQLRLVTERVLVLVDGGKGSARAIRSAAELAGALHGALLAIVVETPQDGSMPFDHNRDLQEAMGDAVDLGAEIVHVEAPSVAAGVEQLARRRRVNHVVLPSRPRSGWRRFSERPLSEQLLERLPEVKIHLVAG